MSLSIILILSVTALLIILLIVLYNDLVKAQNLVQTAFADIDVHLTKRAHLVPNIVSVTKGYAQHESELLLKIAEKRSGTVSENIAQTAQSDQELTQSLNKLRITMESYPDLRADGTFIGLMQELGKIEDHLVFARRFFNGTTREYNNKVQSFPSSLIAGIFGFHVKPFYVIGSENERNVPTF
jgi:LemA protein